MADAFFVADVNNAGERISLIAGLRGLLIASLPMARGMGGVHLRYKRALGNTVMVHMSDTFKAKYAQTHALIKWACELPHGQWAIVSELATVTSSKSRAIVVCCNAETAGVERKIPIAARKRVRVLTKPELVDFVGEVDLERSGHSALPQPA